ncbi:hypothetical protein SK128_018584 [Halocaridina rubra]|uniref:Uncharacterized protein n=1 Tax=Halocaridina rubra TaxID=373956 RepID=A0AAN8X4Y3_HALRR
MEKKRLIIIITTTLVIGLLIIVIATLASQTTQKENYVSECPVDFGPRPLIVVSLDGFRPDYLRRGQTPVLKALADAGVQAQYMISTYPTVTFPNHYTMVTGLYPETHGIIENNFFDPEFQREFTLSGPEKDEGRWWGGEPIWNTLTKHGKKSASYFWPGSSAPIGGQHPTYWFKYDKTVNFTARINQVLEWISLPNEERPVWISLYFNQPDLVSHYEGPYSVDVDEQLRDVDYHIGLLQDGLREQGLLNCVNIMILSDHGMVPTDREQILGVKDFVPNIEEYATFRGDAVGKLTLLNKNRAPIVRGRHCKYICSVLPFFCILHRHPHVLFHTSINHFFGLPLPFLPNPSILSIFLPTYPSSLFRTCPSHLSHLSHYVHKLLCL